MCTGSASLDPFWFTSPSADCPVTTAEGNAQELIASGLVPSALPPDSVFPVQVPQVNGALYPPAANPFDVNLAMRLGDGYASNLGRALSQRLNTSYVRAMTGGDVPVPFCTRLVASRFKVKNQAAGFFTLFQWVKSITVNTEYSFWNSTSPPYNYLPTVGLGMKAHIFVAEAGTPPYQTRSDGSLTINVPSLQVALDGSRTSVALSVENITDNTGSNPTTYLKYMWTSQQLTPYGAHATEDEPPSVFSFSLADHEVRHTTISRVSWASILSQLGGLITLSIGYVWMLFRSSGFLNATGKDMYIFKWLPQSWLLKYLEDAPPRHLIRPEDQAKWRDARRAQ